MRALRKRFASPEGGRRSGSSESVRRCDGPQVLGRPQCNGFWNTSGGTDPPELQRRSDSTSKVVRFWSSSPAMSLPRHSDLMPPWFWCPTRKPGVRTTRLHPQVRSSVVSMKPREGSTPSSRGWRLYDRAMKPGEIICHADHGPWNCVYRGGMPIAWIDWDSCRPDEPILDLAQAAW